MNDSQYELLRDSIQETNRAIERIELRLVGDPSLQSEGLVQDVDNLKDDQRSTAEILTKLADRMDATDSFRERQEELNSEFKKSVKVGRLIRNVAKAAVIVFPFLAGVIGWLASLRRH